MERFSEQEGRIIEAEAKPSDKLSEYVLQWWRGDAHTHSKESTRPNFGYAEGIYDLKEAIDYYGKLGLDFVCFTEHASSPGKPEQQSAESEICQSLLAEAEKITEINKENQSQPIALSGVEVNILFAENGQPQLDIPPEVLKKLDLVIASRHAIANEKDPDAIKQSLLFAIRNPNVDVIGHPDRLTRHDNEKSKEYWRKYWAIWPEILAEMIKNNKAFEINLNSPPSKKLIDMAAKAGVNFLINYDAHDFNQYKKEQTKLTINGETAKKHWARDEASEEELEILDEYKTDRLAHGPGAVAILKLVRWLKRLEKMGITPDRVVNSSRKNLLEFLNQNSS